MAEIEETTKPEDIEAQAAAKAAALRQRIVTPEELVPEEDAPEQQEAVKAEEEPVAKESTPQKKQAGTAEAAGEPERDDGSMSIMQHLDELRTRIIRSGIAIVLGSCVAYYFLDEIMAYITAPAGKLYFMQPAEAFFTYVKVTVCGGCLVALPVIFYQAWRFLLPALTIRERLLLGLLVPFSVILFLAGLLFSFQLVLPLCIKFFMGMGTDTMQPMFSIEKYLDFIFTFVLPFGVIFELPLIMVVLALLGIVNSDMMQKQFRMVILITFILGALLTPPDVISQCMLALPMIALYGFGYFIVKYILRK